MKTPQNPTLMSGVFQNIRRLAPARSLFIAAAFCMTGQVNAQVPDLTAGGVPNDNEQWNLGPTGLTGWCYSYSESSANARQFLVRYVDPLGPSAGIIALDDVILGASGTGADPVNFAKDARIAFAEAIGDAEAQSPATLKILRWRAGVTSIVPLTLETLGAYSATAPYNCPKSAAILEKGIQWMMNTNANDNNWRYSALTLLAANDPNNPNNAARQAKAAADVRQLILTPAQIALFTSGKSMGSSEKPWTIGPKLIALSEYYLQTGDPDPNVIASIRAYAHCAANGQSMFGTSGHYFTNPGVRNAPVNGPYNVGYGVVMSAGMPCYLGLTLAQKCGLNDPVILAGIERAGNFLSQYTHLGCAGYGEQPAYEFHDNNGRAGLQALAYQFEGDRLESTKYFAKASTAGAIAERDTGHTGSFFAYLYSPLGANVGGPDAMAYYFRETKWMYELARRWDGSFVYNSWSNNGVEINALSPSSTATCLMATPMLLTYAMPLRQTYLTGKNQNTANWITPAEMPEVSAASAHIYNAASRTTTELLSDLGSWSPKVRRSAGRELKLRTADHAAVIPTLQATAANESANFLARAGACLAMGEIGDSNSVPLLVSLSSHPNYVLRYAAARAIRDMPVEAIIPHVNAIMQASITNTKPVLPLDPEDPLQLVNGFLSEALFYPYKALHNNNLVGIDRELLYGAMRACASNPLSYIRQQVHSVYYKLTPEDFDNLADLLVGITYDSAPAGPKSWSSRELSLPYLQSKGVSEGVPLAIRLAEDLTTNNGGIVEPLKVLENYAASSNSVTPFPDVEHFCKVLITNSPKFGIAEAQAVLAAIAADTSPDAITPYKSIEWIFPDHASFNLPQKSTVLRVHSTNRSNPVSTYTWRKLRGAGAVSFLPNGTSAAKDASVVFEGAPGKYLFEVTMSDSHGLTEVSKTVEITLRNTGGTLPPNAPPSANGQSLTVAQGTPTQVTLTGADPEGYALNYTVTGNPTHGFLSGTAPHLVYTAIANYTGADSITFQVQDSEGQVATATVNITVNASAPVGLAIYEPFNYAAGNLHGKSGSSEIGFTGTWTTGSQITVESPSLAFGTIPNSGNRVKSVSANSPGGSRPISSSALAGRGLLNNGSTLWFSAVMGGYGGYNANGNSIHFALANNSFPSGGNIPNDGIIPGSGLGFQLKGTKVIAAQFYDASVGNPLLGVHDGTVNGGIVNDNQRLVVGKITWGATSDTIEIYLPDQDMILPSAPTSTLTANVDQSTFDTLTFSRPHNVLLDEIRFGATLQSVLQGTVAMTPDVTAPTPNPMTFAVAPAPASTSSITMTATPALDGMGVEYLFTCTAGGGDSSGWQTSNVYTDSGLTPGVTYSYTVKSRDHYPALNETAASAAASAIIPALGTVPGLQGLPQSQAQTLITNAALTVGTVTPSASYSMTVPAGHVISQSPADGASAAYGSAVNFVISIGQDPVLPVLTSANIVDNKGGATVEVGTPITFTLTFNKDIDAATLSAADFINIGDAPISIGTITETSPGVVTVSVTPNGTVAGTLRFAVVQGAVIEDTLGNDLNTSSPIIDDTVISIIPIQPKIQVFTGTNSNNDNWNTATNWNTNTGPVPSGTDSVIIPAGKQVTANIDATPLYSGNLTLGIGAQLRAGVDSITIVNALECLGTPGSTTISMAGGSKISLRHNFSPIMPAISLQGDSEIEFGIAGSLSQVPAGADPIFNYPITGPYKLTFNGRNDCTANLNAANNFGELLFSLQNGSLFTINANTAGALGGNVTVPADPSTGTKGVNLVFAAANAMADTATLSLYGNTGSLITVNANDTIGGLKLNGVNQLPGTYNSSNATWLVGTGTLTVTGASLAYWNPSGGPSGTWDDSDIWNTQANLGGTNNTWAPGQIAAFNAAGTYGVTLSGTRDIGGLVVSNGAITLSGGGLSLSSNAPVSVASGASFAIDTVIEQSSLGLGLHKSGAGTLNLLAENTFTGAVAIGAGTLSIATIDNAGAPSALGQYPDAGIGGLILAGGTLRYTGGNATVNRGFTFTGSSTIDINNPGTSLALANVEVTGTGTLTVTGGAGSSLGLGHIRMVHNNLTLNPTIATMSVASVEAYSNISTKPNLTLSGSSTGNVITGNIFVTPYPGDSSIAGIGVIKTGTSDWKIAGVLSSVGGAYAPRVSVTVNQGTLTLAGSNTYTGETRLNNDGKLVLDFAATNTSKIGGVLAIGGGTLELKGGNHVEVVTSTNLNVGPTIFINRNGGAAKLRMNAITRAAGSTIIFADSTAADTDRTNTNGILGGYATVGANWAVNSTNGTDGAITALASYTPWTNSGGSSTANYLLTSGDTLGGALAANSLKISNTGFSQTLNLGANNLTITSTSATALGGVLYTGGAFGKCTINGTGGVLASSTTGELVVHTHDGTLIVNAPIVTSGATAGFLTKSGNGSLVLGGTNVYTGTTRVASGKLFVNGSLSNVGVGLTVDPGATLGGSGTVGRNITIANNGKLEFNLSTPAASHVPLTRSSGRTMAFSGSSVLTITATAGAAPGLYTLITGGNNITGSAPATVILPPGWTADAPVISANQLRINITNVVAPPNVVPIWSGNPINQGNTNEDAPYNATLANDAYDANNNPLTFAKVNGSAWLNVATNGTLSGTPANSDVGANSFTISVSDGIGAPVETTLNINVVNTNDAPVWSSNPLNGPDATEDAAYNQNMATAASDVDAGATLNFAKVSGPSWLSIDANGTISGTPSNAEVGLNVFTVSVSDGIALPVETTLNITVINTNDAPVWAGNPLTGAEAIEDSAYSGSLTSSVLDVDAGASLSYTKISGPAWLNVASNGDISGIPSNANVGANSFTVSVSDGIAPPVETTINITVINTNDTPFWTSNPITGANATEDAAYSESIAGSAGDIDPGAALAFTKVSGPAWLSVAADGVISGTPSNDDVGANSFTVSVSDGIALPVEVTLNLTVINTNDAPVFAANPIIGSDGTDDTAYVGTLAGSASDVDAGATLTYAKISGPAWLSVASNGTLSGAPVNSDAGLNSFTVSVTDGIAPAVNATLNITIINTNEAPVAVAQSVTTDEDTALPITLTGTDADNDPLTYLIVTQPGNGTLSGTAPNLTYTPAANTNGADSFTFKVNDGTVDSPVATVAITVTPVADVPAAVAQSVTTNEDTALPITLAGTDGDNDPLTYSIVTQPANGTLSGTVPNMTYTPSANYSGSDNFTFRANDGLADSTTATVSISVTAVNDVPVAVAQSVTTAEDTALPITLTGTDVENSALTYTIVTPPANGTLSGTAPNVTYTAATGFYGADSFTFKVNDGTVDSAPATVSITFNPAKLYWDGNDTTGIADGGVGNWDNLLTNWDTLASAGSNFAWSPDSIAVFSGTGATVTLTDNITVGGLAFNKVNNGATYYTINAATNSKTLGFSSGDKYIRLNIGNGGAPNATITGQVAGTGTNVIVAPQNIVASGGGTNFGTVTFNGASTDGWTGSTTINQLGTLATVSTATLTNRVLASTSGITINGGTLQFTRASNSNIDAISEGAISVNGGGTFSVTSSAGGASAIEDIGTVTVNSGQMNFVQTVNNQNGLVLAGLSRGSSTTSAATFSSANFTSAGFSVTGATATAANEIIGTWATTGTTAALQTDYAVYDGSSRFVACGIAASAQSTWSTASAATSNYTMSALASARISGGTKNINAIRSLNNSVTVTASNANITLTGHALAVGDVVTFSAATMPTGLTAGTPYYVVSTAANTIQVSATAGGVAITPTTAGTTVVASGAIQVSSGNNLGTLGILNGSATTLNILQSGGAGSVTLPSATSANLHITAGSGAISIAAPIKDNGTGLLTLVKGGSGILTLSAIGNDFTGGLVVNAGTVRLTGDQSFTGGVTLNGGAFGDTTDGITAAEIDGNSVTVNGNASMVITGGETLASAIALNSTGILKLAAMNTAGGGTVSGVLSGTGKLTNSSGGSGNGTVILSNTANTHTGIVSIVSDNNQNFTMAVNSLADSTFPGAGNIQMGGGGTLGGHTFALHTGAISPLILNNRQVELIGDGGTSVLFKLSNNSTQAFTINTNLLASGTNAKTLTLGGTGAGLSTFAGTITKGSHTTLNLTKADANSTWALTNTANSYNGITTISAGTLRVSALANGGSNSSIGASANVAANLVLSGGTLEYTGAGSTTDRLFSLQSNSTINSSGSGAVHFNNTGAMGFNGNTSAKTLTLTGTNAGANTIAASIANNTGATSITKSGAGKWLLSGTNTYTGATAINAGTLFINGNQSSASGNVTVAANATLGGTGTIGGNTTISTGGKLEFDLSTAAGSHNPLDLITGKGLTFSGASTLTITSNGAAEPGTYTLVTGGNNIAGVAPATLNLPAGWTATVSISGNSLLLNVTSIGGAFAPSLVNQSKLSKPAEVTPIRPLSSTSSGIAATAPSAAVETPQPIIAPELPLPWTSGDIGTAMLEGNTVFNAGSFTQAGSGIIGSTSDTLRFTYQTLTGDGEITARISSLGNTGTSSRVGVMIRDSLAANSMQAFMGMSGSNAYQWTNRSSTGGTTSTTSSSTGTLPNTWVRLIRSGTTITAYKSADGTAWTSVGSTTAAIGTTCYIGLAVGSGSDTSQNTSQFSNVSVTP